jgi:CBS domain-containing protein
MPSLDKLLTGRPVISLPPHASVLDAAHAMHEQHVGAILIVDGGARPLGIFTERDLMTRVVVTGRKPSDVRVDSVMTRDLFVARVDAQTEPMLREMQRRHVRHLPIVAPDGRAIAMLSLRDLLRFDLAARESEVQALHEYIGDAPAEGPSQRPSSF